MSAVRVCRGPTMHKDECSSMRIRHEDWLQRFYVEHFHKGLIFHLYIYIYAGLILWRKKDYCSISPYLLQITPVYIYIYIYIYIHIYIYILSSRTDCFVVLQLIFTARHTSFRSWNPKVADFTRVRYLYRRAIYIYIYIYIYMKREIEKERERERERGRQSAVV